MELPSWSKVPSHKQTTRKETRNKPPRPNYEIGSWQEIKRTKNTRKIVVFKTRNNKKNDGSY